MKTKQFKLVDIDHHTHPKLDKGQGLVEFALILPILILIFFGVLDLGRAFHAAITVNNASREGARFGAMHRLNVSGITAAAVAEAAGSGVTIAPGDVAVTCIATDTTVYLPPCYRGDAVRVTINYNFELVISFILPGGIHIIQDTEMNVP